MITTSHLIWQDKQHQDLFDLIADLSSEDTGTEIFVRLQAYAENHFALEEEYMKRLQYPGINEHVAAHNRFREELAQMIRDCNSYDEAVRHSLSMFLGEWLKRHVLGIDKQLEDYILKSESK